MKTIHTIIVGGGQAGLAASYSLKQKKIEHLVLEQAAQAGHAWREQRWDSFSLLTPNWTIRMPGCGYEGDDPDGFLQRDEIVTYFEKYIERFQIPVRYNHTVSSIRQSADGTGYVVQSNQDEYLAKNVVIATGMFQFPKIPAFASHISPLVTQIHAMNYHNPIQLPAGGVLVVGSAQSGAQIAEELYESGRKVYLAVGGAGRVPRRYRGKDIFFWMDQAGFFDRTVDMLDSPQKKFAANPHLSGKNGGHTISLHSFAQKGIQLLGHAVGGENERVFFAADLKESLAKADQFEAMVVQMIDHYIENNGISAPAEILPVMKEGYSVKEICVIDLQEEGIHTIIWALGFTGVFSIVKLPVTDQDSFPVTTRGVTAYPGLYFIGMPYLYKQKSGLLLGVADDAAYIADHIFRK